jgi:hypothetical protein
MPRLAGRWSGGWRLKSTPNLPCVPTRRLRGGAVELVSPRALIASWPKLDTPQGRDHDAGSPEPGPIMDIVVWLRSLGLGSYEAAFRERIDLESVDWAKRASAHRSRRMAWSLTGGSQIAHPQTKG